MHEKILVLTSNSDAYYFGHLSIPDVYICSVFQDSPDKHSIILKFFRKIECSLTRVYYLDWYKRIGEFSKIIITDIALAYDCKLLENIRRKSKHSKCYIYSWNLVKNEKKHYALMELAKKTDFSFYCYDKGTCLRYGLKFNTIMYDKKLHLPNNEVEYDMFFLGFLKDRKEKILTLYEAMTNGGLRPQFVIVGRKDGNLPFSYRESYVNYYEYLEMVSKSRAILDISQKGQDGYSMRVMEAIFFDKKLITTNKYVKDSIFYNENNIYIINLEKIVPDEIKHFFELEFHPYPKNVKEYYSFEEWIDRFN